MNQEENSNKLSRQNETVDSFNSDDGLSMPESKFYDLTRLITDSDRLVYIYTLTGIIIATVIVTLCRSFIFFTVSIYSNTDYYLILNDISIKSTFYHFFV